MAIKDSIKEPYYKFFGAPNVDLLVKDFMSGGAGSVIENIPDDMLEMLFTSYMRGVITAMDPSSNFNRRFVTSHAPTSEKGTKDETPTNG